MYVPTATGGVVALEVVDQLDLVRAQHLVRLALLATLRCLMLAVLLLLLVAHPGLGRLLAVAVDMLAARALALLLALVIRS